SERVRRASRSRLALELLLDPVRLDLVHQRPQRQAERLCRLGLVAVELVQRAHDQIDLVFAKVLAVVARHVGSGVAVDRLGGLRTIIVFSRYNKSWRNSPAATIASRSRCVAASTRTSTSISRSPPMRVTFFVSSTRRSAACAGGASSPTSSSNTVPPSACSK